MNIFIRVTYRILKNVKLLFPDEKQLRRFYMIIESPNVEMNIRTLSLICDCQENEINKAIQTFGAKVEAIKSH